VSPLTDVTAILSAIEAGDPQAAEQLLPLVYEELRKLATHKLAQETPGQTLQATALVHEAYLRRVDEDRGQHSSSRGHAFAAAEARGRTRNNHARRPTAQRPGAPTRRHPTKCNRLKSPDARDEAARPGGTPRSGLHAAGLPRSPPPVGESTLFWKYFLAPSTLSLST
jgi:hypothetical protein